METGTGKTYVYIKTLFEKSFDITADLHLLPLGSARGVEYPQRIPDLFASPVEQHQSEAAGGGTRLGPLCR